MGYITTFELDVTGSSEEELAEFKEAALAGEETPSGVPYTDFLSGYSFSSKWYRCEEDVTELSRLFPELLFSIEAAGKEPGDLWRAWARNGEYRRIEPELVWPEIDLDTELPPAVASDEELARRKRVAELEQELASLKKKKA